MPDKPTEKELTSLSVRTAIEKVANALLLIAGSLPPDPPAATEQPKPKRGRK